MDVQAKQQIVERVKQAQNILVTVAANPTVDQLAACVGLTLLLNRMDKHATAVFSGVIPSTIEFLQPEKTIEANTDSLRDFIISLDKNKADKLRYKVEDQVVRIFITPYRTSLSEKDLIFSQGDFNVEVVLALGVKDRNQVDQAIAAHGRILHDATVVTVNAGQGQPVTIGAINWQDPQASSLSEMIVSISEAFGAGLIDNQMATSFLTGIVAETERFRNAKTTPKVMTMAAQLMAAGANQQLIATKLEPAAPVPSPAAKQPPRKAASPKAVDGKLKVAHKPGEKDTSEIEIGPNEIRIDEQGNLKTPDEIKAEVDRLKKLRDQQKAPPLPPPVPPPPPPPAAPLPQAPLPPLPAAPPPPPPPLQPLDSKIAPEPTVIKPTGYMPTPGPSRTDILPSVSPIPGQHELLDPIGHQPALAAPFTANTEPEWHNPYNTVSIDPLASQTGVQGVVDHAPILQPPLPPQAPPPPSQPMQAPLPTAQPPVQQAPVYQPPPPVGGSAVDVDSARNAVASALAAQPFDPSFNPVTSLNAQPVSLDLHPPGPPALPPPAPNGTPSLNLPNGAVAASTADMMASPPPPPVPPPLPLANNPGAMVPTPPSQPAPPQQQQPPPPPII